MFRKEFKMICDLDPTMNGIISRKDNSAQVRLVFSVCFFVPILKTQTKVKFLARIWKDC